MSSRSLRTARSVTSCDHRSANFVFHFGCGGRHSAWLGPRTPYELSIEIAPIPLNVVFRCWHLCYWWLVRGGPQARTLAERSFEAGLKEGIKTGRSQMRAEMYCDLGEVGRALRSVAFMEGWLDDHR